MGWQRLTGEHISNIENAIRKDVENYLDEFTLKFITACDSQVRRGKNIVTYTKTIIMWRVGHGARVYFENDIEPYNKIQLQQRLFMETYKAVETALWLDRILIDYALEVESVHIDLNSNKKFLSNASVKECLGYIHGFNMVGMLKPSAWGATVADRKTK